MVPRCWVATAVATSAMKAAIPTCGVGQRGGAGCSTSAVLLQRSARAPHAAAFHCVMRAATVHNTILADDFTLLLHCVCMCACVLCVFVFWFFDFFSTSTSRSSFFFFLAQWLPSFPSSSLSREFFDRQSTATIAPHLCRPRPLRQGETAGEGPQGRAGAPIVHGDDTAAATAIDR